MSLPTALSSLFFPKLRGGVIYSFIALLRQPLIDLLSVWLFDLMFDSSITLQKHKSINALLVGGGSPAGSGGPGLVSSKEPNMLPGRVERGERELKPHWLRNRVGAGYPGLGI